MPKNKGAGGKNRRKGKGTITNRELVYKIVGQEYGQVTKSLGNGYMEVLCFTSDGNIPKRAHIRGKMRKRAWMAVGDIVLVSPRNFQDNVCDIILKYTSNEAHILRNKHQLPDSIDINKTDMVIDDDNYINFGNNSDDKDDDDSQETIVAKQNRNLNLPPSDSEDEVDIHKL